MVNCKIADWRGAVHILGEPHREVERIEPHTCVEFSAKAPAAQILCQLKYSHAIVYSTDLSLKDPFVHEY